MGRAAAFETVTRIGFAARGLLYGLIGLVALRSGRAEDGPGILDELAGGAGSLLVGAMAVGFAGYGAWRLLEAWLDSEGRGTDAKGVAIRLCGAGSGLIHLGLAALALRIAAGEQGSGGRDSAEQGAAAALELPGGWLLLVAGAAVLLVVGLYQLGKAWKLGFLDQLDPRASRRRWVAWLGRAGFLARGLVFLVMAWLLWRAGQAGRSSDAGGVGEALGSLPNTLEIMVAAGLILFGLFSLVEARFRRIRNPHLVARLTAAVH